MIGVSRKSATLQSANGYLEMQPKTAGGARGGLRGTGPGEIPSGPLDLVAQCMRAMRRSQAITADWSAPVGVAAAAKAEPVGSVTIPITGSPRPTTAAIASRMTAIQAAVSPGTAGTGGSVVAASGVAVARTTAACAPSADASLR